MSSPLSPNMAWELMNPRLAAILNPIIANPTNSSTILNGITLINGETTINHGLGRKMLGWIITDINGLASIYRSQPMNSSTISLTSNAVVTVNIEVF